MGTQIERVRAVKLRYDEAMSDLLGEGGELNVLREAFSSVVQAVMSAEDEGWTRLAGVNEEAKGISLSEIKKLTPWLESEVKKSGGLLGRALRLKTNHIVGRGFQLEATSDAKVAPRHQAIIDDPDNQSAVFSQSAIKDLNRILFTSGNLFIVYDEQEKLFTPLAIDLNIVNSLSYPDDPSKLKYILRTYTDQNDLSGKEPKVVEEWVPTVNYRDRLRRQKIKLPESLPSGSPGKGRLPVNQSAVIIEKRINNDNGDVWGLPDSFSAAPWAVVYSNYLRDGAKLQSALAAIAFVVKAKTQAAAKAANAQIQNARVGQAAITGPETEINSMPRAGAIDLYEGRPLVAMVAANLDVSTTGITSDPGPGGSYASENALSAPEQMAALSRQEDFRDIFSQIFRAMGASNMTINFARLDTDPIHRVISSAVLARVNGGINQLEFRNTMIELLDIVATSTELPKPDEWTGSKQSTLEVIDVVDGDSGSGGVPGQGQSGSIPGGLDDGNDARDSDRDAGTA